MAGGWGKQGSGVPLSQRVRAGARDEGTSADAGRGEPCPARHCWVADAADGRGVKRPGLLAEWRRSGREAGSAWEGRVVYAAELRSGAWTLVEEWVPAALLTPL